MNMKTISKTQRIRELEAEVARLRHCEWQRNTARREVDRLDKELQRAWAQVRASEAA